MDGNCDCDFVAVPWLECGRELLKLAGELLAYCLSMKKMERMSLPVSDPVSIQMYREVCRKGRYAEYQNSGRMQALPHRFLPDFFIQSCIFRQPDIPQKKENWSFIMNLPIIVTGISGIRCFFRSVHRYTGSIRFSLSC